jgi:serine/threonine-protein kinase RsbT
MAFAEKKTAGPMMSVERVGELEIRTERDILAARHTVRDAAAELGFATTEITRIVTAASELARNVFKYAGEGTMRWSCVAEDERAGLELEFSDRGPGIQDLELALSEGFSTGGGLGMGLPGAKRLVDEFEIQSAPGEGTRVVLRKWRRKLR